jgi:two-component system, OmpR family, response regulator CpxR
MSSFVLVVDDDESIRETLCELLEDEGHRAVGASNGQEALDFLRSDGRPCMILLDVMMPVMDGAAFRAEQLGDPNLSSIPVALITAAGPDIAASLRAEVLLPKPLRIESVLELVERFCPNGATA